MDPLTVRPPNDPHNHCDLMEATIAQGDWPDLAQETPHSPLLLTLNEADRLSQGDADPVDPNSTFWEYISDYFEVTASTSPLARGSLRDENSNLFAEQEYTTTTATQDSNKVIPRPPFGDPPLDTDYNIDPDYGQGGHDYPCECALCEATYCHLGLRESRGFKFPIAPASQCSGGVRASQFLDSLSPKTELQGASGPPFPTVYLPAVQQPPTSADLLQLLKKCDGGRATCLWIQGGNECGFSSQIDLVKRHIKRVHFRLRPCKCEHCGRKFFNNYGLSLHYNTHTGARPFVCDFCGRGFSSPSGKSHHRVHMHGYKVPRWPIPAAEGHPELSIAMGGKN